MLWREGLSYCKRIIYINKYIRDCCRESVGYLELEKCDSSLRIKLCPGFKELSKCTLYLYALEGDIIKAVNVDLLKVMKSKNCLNCTIFDFDGNDVGGVEFECIDGLLFRQNENDYLLAKFTSYPFTIEKVIFVNSFAEPETIEEEPEKPETKRRELEIIEPEKRNPEIKEPQKEENVNNKNARIKNKSVGSVAENFKDLFIIKEHIQPFSDDNLYDCVKVGKEELALLPQGIKGLINSFLLHGLYTYEHILVGKVRCKRNDDIYAIGVPGEYDKNEEFIASLYGFDKFKLAGKRPKDNPGLQFGYWYTCFKSQ